VATGMESFLTVANFLVANVFDHMMLRSWDWRVTYFYFVILLERVETAGTPDVNILSVASKLGGLDTLRDEAKMRAGETYGQGIFRSGGDKPFGGDGREGIVWNGKSSPTAANCCLAFNLGSSGKHGAKHLLPDGTCKFKHRCDAWVSDKGSKGTCDGEHARAVCTNPNKIAKPLD
jgi:hypothetical protein